MSSCPSTRRRRPWPGWHESSASARTTSPPRGAKTPPASFEPWTQERDLRRRIAAIPGLGTIGAQALSGTDGEELLPLIAAGLDAIERSDLPKTAKRELTSMFVDNLIHDAARRYSELLLMLRLATTGSQSG